MYISRIALNLGRISTQRLISSPNKMHGLIEKCFPPNVVRASEEGRLLWRTDISLDNANAWLYVVSVDKPDFTHIVEQAGWPMYPEWETKDYTAFLNRLAVGQQWRFQLTANPVRTARVDKGRYSRKREDQIIGKLQAHITPEQQIDWLMQRSEKNGFTIAKDAEHGGDPCISVMNRHRMRFHHNGGNSKNPISLSTAVFQGIITVDDPDLLRHALCHGIGRGKAFGCGLLTLAPVKESES